MAIEGTDMLAMRSSMSAALFPIPVADALAPACDATIVTFSSAAKVNDDAFRYRRSSLASGEWA